MPPFIDLSNPKAIDNELAIQQTRANEFKFKIDRIQTNLRDVKKKVFGLKKKEQAFNNKKKRENKLWLNDLVLPEKKIVAGGFNMMA